MALEEQFEITLDEEGVSPALRPGWLQKRGVLTRRASLFRRLAGAEKITTVQEAADLIQSQLK